MSSQTPARQMHLALMLSGDGGAVGGWRMPGAIFGPEDFSLIRRCAEMAEQAKFDMLFAADVVAAMGEGGRSLEAMTVMAVMAGVTKHIGLGATVSTTYSEPYNVARMLATIDHLSGGRAAWNVVTTENADAAANFGREASTPKAERYAMAGEFLEIVKGLWDSWEDDSLLLDHSTGRLVDSAKRHVLNHKGKYFSVKGPLNVSRPPQGYPVVIQAGSSELGMPFAAEIAEVTFTVHADMDGSRVFNEQLRAMAVKMGRAPDAIRILPGVCPIVAETDAKARELADQLSAFVEPEAAWAKLRSRLGVEVAGLDPEGPLPVIPYDQMRGHAKTLTALAARKGLNLRQIRDYVAIAAGHPLLIGTPEAIADELELWFRSGAGDGFMIKPPYFLGPLEAFTEGVVPILQKRGLFRTEYSGNTLRENLGLPRPDHPNAR